MGALKAGARHAAVARGRIWQRRQYVCGGRTQQVLTVRDNLEDSIVCVRGVARGDGDNEVVNAEQEVVVVVE
jgi:hypothetical protein